MKKLTLILALLVTMVTTAMAQETITISASQNLSQTWTSNGKTDETGTYGPWGTEVITNYPTGITPSSGNEVHIATTNVTISELGRLNFTFTYSSGEHRLNILGVDLLNAESEVVASDYHNGQAGGNPVNNTYSFVAPAGTYTIRYFVEHNTNGNDLRRTGGTITGTLTNIDATKAAIEAEFESFRGHGMLTDAEIDESVTAIQAATASTIEEFKLLETTHFIYFYSTLDKRCFTFNSKGRETTNGRYLGVKGLNLDGTMDVVATDANELKNIWKLEYVDGKYFRLKNIAYDVYSKTTSEKVLAGNTTLRTTSQSKDAGLFFVKAQENGTVSIGADGGNYSFIHESNWSGHEIVRWEALPNGAASQWTATKVDEPELCSITYNNVYEGNNIQTEKLNVKKNEEYTFVNNFTIKTGLRLKDTTPVPAAEVITEDKVVTYEYENILPFEAATVTNENRLAQGSKLYKITLRGKNVQLNADGTEFEYNNNAAIENQLFAVAGSVFDDWQMFNYAAGLNKPIWSPDNNNGTKMVPTAGVKDKFEIVLHNDNTGNHWSFKKKGTNYYLHDYGSKFAVWNDGTAYDDPGSYVVFTEATDKEISIATLNLDIKATTPYLSEDLLDATIKTTIQSTIDEANTAIANANSTAEQLNEIDARLYQLTKDAANDLVVANADGFKNNGIYTFVTSRGWLLYTSENPDVVASSKKYNDPEPSVENDDCQWAMHKSTNTGFYYMYNIGAGKFVGNPTSGNNIPFVATPTNDIKILAGTKSGYPIMVATNTSSVINHFNNSNAPGVANWNGGQGWSADDGSCHAVTKVGFINEETLTSITDMVDVYESYINKPDLLAKIAELTTFKESSFLTAEEKATIDAAITEAQAVYDNPKYSTVAAQINKLNELKKQLQYVTSPEGFKNNAIYTIVAKYNDGNAYVMYDANQGDNGSYAISSSKNFGTTIETGENIPGCQWALYTSTSGKHYLYNIGARKFMGTSNEGNGYIPLNDKPTSADLILKNSADNEYPIMFSVNNGAGVLNHNNGNSFPYGLLNWHSTTGWNDTSSAANVHKVTVVGELDTATLATIEDLVEAFETVGLKQLELKTLLDNIYAGYYDAWSSSPNKWRINEGVNNYSQKEGDEDFVTAYNEARAYIDLPLVDTSVEDIETQINRMNGLVANLTINQPEDGKYYKIRCTLNNKYLSSNTNNNGKLQMDGADRTFYYDGGFMAYTAGCYVQLASGANNVTLAAINTKTTATLVDGKRNKNKSGSYLIQINERWLRGGGDLADSGSSEPNNQDGYNWWLEEITSLPVTITAAGYASFYAPVAVEVPSGIEAYYLTNIIGKFASMTKIESGIIPANTGVILTGENGEPATEGTYNLAITINDVSINNNMFKGTIATEYVTGDAYVLAIKDNNVGLYSVTLNKENETAFQNNSHKAYLPKSPEAQNSAGFRFSFGGTTDIEEVETESENVKAIYDLTGRKLSEITKPGIYIVNGNKVIVR